MLHPLHDELYTVRTVFVIDQRISKAEAAQEEGLRKRFAGMDASGDGYLSKAEFRARPSDEPFE